MARAQKTDLHVATILKLKNILRTLEGRTLRVGTEVTVEDESATGRDNIMTRFILVADAPYHIREDLAYSQGEP